MMNLDASKYVEDKSRSNPMVVAMRYPECPINEICCYLVVGAGSVTKQCEFLKADGDTAECIHETT